MSLRYNGVENYAPVFKNREHLRSDQNSSTRRIRASEGSSRAARKNSSLRLTWQATPRNKIAGTYKADAWCLVSPIGVKRVRRAGSGLGFAPLPAGASGSTLNGPRR